MADALQALSASEQLGAWSDWVNDPRGSIPTGIIELDERLRRGGLGPGELVMLGGRTGTRKTTVTLNIIERMLKRGVRVAAVFLDEPTPSYVAKLASAMTGVSHEFIEAHWEDEGSETVRTQYLNQAATFSLSRGQRPTFDALSDFLEMAEVTSNGRPQVVFIDYVELLKRSRSSESTSIPNLMEDLQVWTKKEEVITFALHQVKRGKDDYNGSFPMGLEDLKYGGEQHADIVLATFRPALDKVGNMTMKDAKAYLGDRFDEDDYWDRVNRVRNNANHTFLQLLKNRPGKQPDEQARKGLRLHSVGDSMQMQSDAERFEQEYEDA